MNQITAEAIQIEIESFDSTIAAEKQMEDAIAELNSSQLALVGGGTVVVIL